MRFTQKQETLCAMLLETPRETEICIRDLRVAPAVEVRLLGGDARFDWHQDGADLIVRLPSPLAGGAAYGFAISPPGGRGSSASEI